MNAIGILESDFLEMRHRVLDLAAAFDRIGRGSNPPVGDGADTVQRDPRMVMLYEAVRMLADGKPDRTERIQLVFSLPYDEHWREKR